MPAFVCEILIILRPDPGQRILQRGRNRGDRLAPRPAAQLAEEGDHRARQALELATDPTRFLTTVQVGITLIGTFTATFGGDSLVR